MKKVIVKSIDQEYQDLIKGRGKDLKPRKKRGKRFISWKDLPLRSTKELLGERLMSEERRGLKRYETYS